MVYTGPIYRASREGGLTASVTRQGMFMSVLSEDDKSSLRYIGWRRMALWCIFTHPHKDNAFFPLNHSYMLFFKTTARLIKGLNLLWSLRHMDVCVVFNKHRERRWKPVSLHNA